MHIHMYIPHIYMLKLLKTYYIPHICGRVANFELYMYCQALNHSWHYTSKICHRAWKRAMQDYWAPYSCALPFSCTTRFLLQYLKVMLHSYIWKERKTHQFYSVKLIHTYVHLKRGGNPLLFFSMYKYRRRRIPNGLVVYDCHISIYLSIYLSLYM